MTDLIAETVRQWRQEAQRLREEHARLQRALDAALADWKTHSDGLREDRDRLQRELDAVQGRQAASPQTRL